MRAVRVNIVNESQWAESLSIGGIMINRLRSARHRLVRGQRWLTSFVVPAPGAIPLLGIWQDKC